MFEETPREVETPTPPREESELEDDRADLSTQAFDIGRLLLEN